MEEMRLLLVESALALVPKEHRDHPAVRNWCKRFGRKPHEAVLDVNYHFQFMREWEHPGKWGRPDIVHYTLLYALESPLAKRGLLDVYVHTVEGKVFHVEKGTRLPRGYSRFIGIVSQVLRGMDTPRIHPLNTNIHDLLDKWREESYTIVLLSEEGEKRDWDWLKGKVAVLVGAFAGGPFVEEYGEDLRVSIWDEPLNTWNVVGEVIASRERILGLL